MTLLLDAGALIAFERGDAVVKQLLAQEFARGRTWTTHGGIVGQVWRASARQAGLARVLRATNVIPLGTSLGRDAGRLLAASGTTDVIDAALVAIAADGDRIATSDPADIRVLLDAAHVGAEIVRI
jgi:hypothetical protein